MKKEKHKKYARLLQGVYLSFGAPLGALLLEFLLGRSPLEELLARPELYLYMLFATMGVFALFGHIIGRSETQYRHSSVRDSLTKAFNNEYFHSRLQEEKEFYKRHQINFSVMIFDVDNFKTLNDTYGHQMGDLILKEIAQTIQRCIRKTDVLARIGGDEFCVILTNSNSETKKKIAERIQFSLADLETMMHEGSKINPTLSIGGASMNDLDEADQDLIFDKADEALYQAKEKGRNQLYIYQNDQRKSKS